MIFKFFVVDFVGKYLLENHEIITLKFRHILRFWVLEPLGYILESLNYDFWISHDRVDLSILWKSKNHHEINGYPNNVTTSVERWINGIQQDLTGHLDPVEFFQRIQRLLKPPIQRGFYTEYLNAILF